MSGYQITENYPFAIDEVWEVMTSPRWVARWTTTGRGGRPEDFAPIVGQEFRFVGKPTIGWGGVVYCRVQEVLPPSTLEYTWKGDTEADAVTRVRYLLEPTAAGTRFTWTHDGFTGLGGFAMSRLLASVRRGMLRDGVPPALVELHRERLESGG